MGEEQGKELIEQTQISRLLTNYFAATDDKRLDKAVVEETFTKEARILRPNSSTTLGHHDILAGVVLSATAILIDNNWRISELKNRNVWRIGSGMMEMEYYERPEND